ncbi:hypothetical protein RJ641_015463 [Dillenia turbinata]|uniref:Uncharacterized protein n=1 Tax=Dillenia turbinata TaxID=194707 RepID=A0AAN8YY81_9MAGN
MHINLFALCEIAILEIDAKPLREKKISEWMSERMNFELLLGDIAVRLDLISKFRGLEATENYFNESLMDYTPDIEAMEKLLMEMEGDVLFLMTRNPYAIAARVYAKAGLRDKASQALRKSEHLMFDEVYSIWNKYKEMGKTYNLGYLVMSSPPRKLDDTEEGFSAEKAFIDTQTCQTDLMDKAVNTVKKAILENHCSWWKPRKLDLSSRLKYLKEKGDVESAEDILTSLKERSECLGAEWRSWKSPEQLGKSRNPRKVVAKKSRKECALVTASSLSTDRGRGVVIAVREDEGSIEVIVVEVDGKGDAETVAVGRSSEGGKRIGVLGIENSRNEVPSLSEFEGDLGLFFVTFSLDSIMALKTVNSSFIFL